MTAENCIIIPLTRGQSAIVDQADSDLAQMDWYTYPGKNAYYAHRNGRTNHKRFTQRMHRVILSRILGRDLLPSELVDHVDLNGLNNRRDNLRLANHTQNNANRETRNDNKTGYKGVHLHKPSGKYHVSISVSKKRLYLGLHDTPELAAIAYNNAAKEHFGEFARLNEIK